MAETLSSGHHMTRGNGPSVGLVVGLNLLMKLALLLKRDPRLQLGQLLILVPVLFRHVLAELLSAGGEEGMDTNKEMLGVRKKLDDNADGKSLFSRGE